MNDWLKERLISTLLINSFKNIYKRKSSKEEVMRMVQKNNSSSKKQLIPTKALKKKIIKKISEVTSSRDEDHVKSDSPSPLEIAASISDIKPILRVKKTTTLTSTSSSSKKEQASAAAAAAAAAASSSPSQKKKVVFSLENNHTQLFHKLKTVVTDIVPSQKTHNKPTATKIEEQQEEVIMTPTKAVVQQQEVEEEQVKQPVEDKKKKKQSVVVTPKEQQPTTSTSTTTTTTNNKKSKKEEAKPVVVVVQEQEEKDIEMKDVQEETEKPVASTNGNAKYARLPKSKQPAAEQPKPKEKEEEKEQQKSKVGHLKSNGVVGTSDSTTTAAVNLQNASISGFNILPVQIHDSQYKQYIYYRKETNKKYPVGRTMFVLNLPTQCKDIESIQLFFQTPDIEQVLFSSETAAEPIPKAAHVVLKDSDSLASLLKDLLKIKLSTQKVLNAEKDLQNLYFEQTVVDFDALQNQLDTYMMEFDKDRLLKNREARANKGVKDEDGFVLVTGKKSSYSGPSLDELKDKEEKKKSKNFYMFQQRQQKKKELDDLRKKF
ncbi:hypothetical protein DFA_05413 [Cavenderia fasciculata]|uniref:Ribosomal RNA-processing protein 7 C-terminal domain-containing protein n=1 Tax=Cavenderia fasciculata TaxID=261658 RepID=F4PL59_CACFS|nr:uncharacterized protein DFA_05413 [Cavenderia fasciculata]EGG23281.1 hypothetical protein DFA_05413 [Cavenderia fasciculata]|eukprot:XP_004361132.1 hypothetical protein DFA_05413 [Cavenderia fasciculata]